MLKRITFRARWSTTDIKWRWWSNRGKNQNLKKPLVQKLATTNLEIVLNTPKNPYLNQATQYNTFQISSPKKSQNCRFQSQKYSSIIPVTWNPEYNPLREFPNISLSPRHFFHHVVKPSLMQTDGVHSAGVNVACEHFAFIRLISAIGDFTMHVVKRSS